VIVRIAEIEPLSATIRKLTLVPETGELPVAGAGSHIILNIPGPDRIWKNAYSLINGPEIRARYQIIVRRVAHSRGGSAWLHDHAQIGQNLTIGAPQNLFPIDRLAKNHLLLAAGIGITPFLSYLPALRAPFELHHCGKAEDEAAFAALLPRSRHIIQHTGRNSLNLRALLGAQKLGTHLYVCGPELFMDMVIAEATHLGWPGDKIHSESFGHVTGGAPFIAHLRRSGISVQVGPEQSLLEAIEAAGLAPPYLCRGGACGECELPLMDGTPDHRDHVLSAEQRAANSCILTCVSRALSPELALDY
jgi:ferredoxin-NADP reductase